MWWILMKLDGTGVLPLGSSEVRMTMGGPALKKGHVAKKPAETGMNGREGLEIRTLGEYSCRLGRGFRRLKIRCSWISR